MAQRTLPRQMMQAITCLFLLAFLWPAGRAAGQALSPAALQDPRMGVDVSSRGPYERGDRPVPERLEDTSVSRLPLYGALAGGMLLGGYTLTECVEIGCTTSAPVFMAAAAGALAGALVGWTIDRLRAGARYPRDPWDRSYSRVPRRTSKIALRLQEGQSSHSR